MVGPERTATTRPGAVGADWRQATPRYAWLVVGLGVWFVAGLALVERASFQGLITDVALSPYHALIYGALATLFIAVAVTIDRGREGARDWRGSFPRRYDGLAIGALVAIGWFVLDLVWRQLFGIRPGIESTLAPTRVLVPVTLILVASGPLRDAASQAEQSSLLRWAGVVSLAVIAAAATTATATFNPVSQSLGSRPTVMPRDVSEIWVMTADGTHQTRLLPAMEPGVDYSLPAWSPDGARIAFTRWQNAPGVGANQASNEQSASIWTMTADGSDLRRVVDGAPGADWVPAWSPDGRWIAFASTPTGSATQTSLGGPQPAPNAPPSEGLAPPPTAARGEIWIVRPDGTELNRVTNDPGDNVAPAWSPDGTRIAFASDRTGNYDIWVANRDGTNEMQLTREPALDEMPAWSPDGQTIAFASVRDGSSHIWAMNVDGSTAKQVTSGSGNDWAPAWSADGRTIAFTSDRSGEPEVWSAASDGTGARDLTSSPDRIDGEWSAAWSPDGRRIAYASSARLETAGAPAQIEDLAVAATLLTAALASLVALVLLRLGAPFGSFALILVVNVLFAAFITDEWRFIPAAIVTGLVVDGLMALTRRRFVGRFVVIAVASVGLPLALVLSVGATLAVTGDLGWSPTLLLGVIATTAMIGLVVASVVDALGAVPGSGPPAVERVEASS